MKQELKRYKKDFKKRQNKLITYIKKNYVEYNGESAFLEINKLLLENYLDYYKKQDNVSQSDETRIPIIEQLKECLELITKLTDDNYDIQANEFANKHRVIKGDVIEWDSDASYHTWLAKVKLAESQRTLDYKKVFKLIATHCREWCD